MLGWEFPPYFAGGVGIVCYELTRALALQGHNISYLMPSGPANVKSEHVDLLVADNLVADEKVRINLKRVPSLLSAYTTYEDYQKQREKSIALKEVQGAKKSLYGANLLLEIERFAEKAVSLSDDMDFQVIHAHDWTTFPAAIKLKEKTGKPMVVHVHITEFDKTGGDHADPRIYAIEKKGMDEADLVIAVSNLVKQRLIHQYYVDPKKIRVVYNAVQFTPKPSVKEEYHIKQNDKIVLFLGRVTLQKGPDYFIEAARKVVSIMPNVKFIMAGKGDMLPKMMEKVAHLGLSDKFIFPGFVSRDEGDQLYRMADVFAMPSVSEPFGIVPLEAMYQDTPVIISRQSGISEVLKNCLKVDFWDVDDLANKILASLSYNVMHKELVDNGRKEIYEFNWDKPAAEIVDLYRRDLYVKG